MSNYNDLNAEEQRVILHKGTERAFSGKYFDHKGDGLYHCKQCNAPLYKSNSKFDSGCGWPSFDDTIQESVKEVPDADGRRVEIVCANCGGHLGHVFKGEQFTPKNTRHCVNSVSIQFEEDKKLNSLPLDENEHDAVELKKAYFAAGCFWGVEYHFEHFPGVTAAVSGYMGGPENTADYKSVCTGRSGHLEAVEVTYDPSMVDFEVLTRLFFEIHDPSQTDGQGPDRGAQYLSAIFYNDAQEEQTSQRLIDTLEEKGMRVATKLYPIAPFYKAEDYHQDYYDKTGKSPYCHTYTKRF
ncbi:MAG: bifunctional methionine sulfoxide reductase B/A protein [Campylobacterota bacterium]|nr:bifunctional methionine sulfoxide reductase B/A protein [Campylobacterota bacterium]